MMTSKVGILIPSWENNFNPEFKRFYSQIYEPSLYKTNQE